MNVKYSLLKVFWRTIREDFVRALDLRTAMTSVGYECQSLLWVTAITNVGGLPHLLQGKGASISRKPWVQRLPKSVENIVLPSKWSVPCSDSVFICNSTGVTRKTYIKYLVSMAWCNHVECSVSVLECSVSVSLLKRLHQLTFIHNFWDTASQGAVRWVSNESWQYHLLWFRDKPGMIHRNILEIRAS